MKQYDTVDELLEGYINGECPIYPLEELHRIMYEDCAISIGNLKDLAQTALQEAFGGSVFICEKEEDLKRIKGVDPVWTQTNDGREPDATDTPLVWDVCAYCDDSPSSYWAKFLLCTNNAGGNEYYVPRALWTAVGLEGHMKRTREYWDSQQRLN